jgi:hypothetical protein
MLYSYANGAESMESFMYGNNIGLAMTPMTATEARGADHGAHSRRHTFLFCRHPNCGGQSHAHAVDICRLGGKLPPFYVSDSKNLRGNGLETSQFVSSHSIVLYYTFYF